MLGQHPKNIPFDVTKTKDYKKGMKMIRKVKIK